MFGPRGFPVVPNTELPSIGMSGEGKAPDGDLFPWHTVSVSKMKWVSEVL